MSEGPAEDEIFEAIRRGEIEAVRQQLPAIGNINEILTREEWPPLMVAANWNAPAEIVRLLLSKGADPYLCRMRFGQNRGDALHNAVENNSLDCVSVLLDHGMDPDAGDTGFPPSLLTAIFNDAAEVFDLLLERGCNVNSSGVFGTPLIMAAQINQTDFVAKLLEAGADPYLKNNKDETVFDIIKTDSDIYRFIKKHTVDQAAAAPYKGIRENIAPLKKISLRPRGLS